MNFIKHLCSIYSESFCLELVCMISWAFFNTAIVNSRFGISRTNVITFYISLHQMVDQIFPISSCNSTNFVAALGNYCVYDTKVNYSIVSD